MNKPSIVENPPFAKNYSPSFLELDYGKGSFVTDTQGNEYLDLGSGIAVNALGYGREDLAEIAANQMKKLIHTSNLYTTKPPVELAKRMTAPVKGLEQAFAAVHFGNSGAEANEAAIKYARLYSLKKYGPNRHKILYFDHAFHGRTLGALSCTWKKKYKAAFEPLLPGTVCSEYNNVDQLVEVLKDNSFAAVIVESLQGEGGLRSISPEFTQALNLICREKDIILIEDEVQTGMGRTGEFFSCTTFGLKPDIISLSKPLAGGLPLSATLIPKKINDFLSPGDHGTTFGGGPVTTAVATYIWDTINKEAFLKEIREKGRFLTEELNKLASELSLSVAIRGRGLLQGIEVPGGAEKAAEIYLKAREEGLLVLISGGNLMRIAPPLTITKDEISLGIERLKQTFRRCI